MRKIVSIKSIFSIFLLGSVAANAQETSLLWEISKAGVADTSYLFGTIHAYDSATIHLSKKIFKAIDKCSSFAMEVNPEEVDYATFMSRIRITNNPEEEEVNLEVLMGEAAFAKLMAIPSLKRMGESYIKYLKPIFVTSYLYVDEKEESLPSVDKDLYFYAKSKGKTIAGLETMNEQLDAADSIPLIEQAAMLAQSLEGDSTPSDALKKLWEAYKNQDFSLLEKAMEESNPSPLFSEFLLERRNKLMTERIDQLISNHSTSFIAIGALHLGDTKSSKGVVNLLKEKGYQLKPVKIKL